MKRKRSQPEFIYCNLFKLKWTIKRRRKRANILPRNGKTLMQWNKIIEIFFSLWCVCVRSCSMYYMQAYIVANLMHFGFSSHRKFITVPRLIFAIVNMLAFSCWNVPLLSQSLLMPLPSLSFDTAWMHLFFRWFVHLLWTTSTTQKLRRRRRRENRRIDACVGQSFKEVKLYRCSVSW